MTLWHRVHRWVSARAGRLSPRDRRAIRLGLWLLTPPVAFVWTVRPVIRDFAAAQERLATERDLLSRERSAVAMTARVTEETDSARFALEASAARLMPGTSLVTASASLSRYLTERAARHRVQVQGAETGAAAAEGDELVWVTVEVRAVTDLSGVIAWLDDLEGGPRLIHVDELRLTPSVTAGPEDEVDEEVLGVVLRASALSPVRLSDSGAVAMGVSQ